MDIENIRFLVRQDLALRALSWQLHNILYFIFYHNREKLSQKITTPDQILSKFRKYFDVLDSTYKDEIEQLFIAEAQRLISQGEKTKRLNNRLIGLQKQIEIELLKIHESVEKAMGFCLAMIDIAEFDTDQEYDVFALFHEVVPPDRVASIVSLWKQELRNSIREQTDPIPLYKLDMDSQDSDNEIIEYRDNVFPVSKLFWVSRDFQETLDAVSRYRFLEVFNIGDFQDVMQEIEQIMSANLAEWGNPSVYELWLAQRSSMLCARIRPFIEIALASIVKEQDPDGWWSSDQLIHTGNRARFRPSTYRTAMACFVIFRLSRDDEQISRAKNGLQWLVTEQMLNGAWTMEKPDYNSEEIQKGYIHLVPKEDIFTTLLSLEAIKASGMNGYEYTVKSGENWIMSQQEYDGSWPKSDLPYPFLTVLILEYFLGKIPLNKPVNNYLDIARFFILRANEFALENNGNTRRLSVITAFQGVEALLYGCLSNPKVNVKIFEKSNETIGLRKALTNLQSHFQTTKLLKQGQPIEYRNEMDRLAYIRDQIVHKGIEVGEKDTLELVNASWKFANLLCNRIFGTELL
jgi:hypothetical protein